MIVDSSALLAIILKEDDEARYLRAVSSVAGSKMSVASYLEVALKLDKAEEGVINPILDATLERLGVSLIPVTIEHGLLARDANFAFGRRHPARLNFGDCLTYALAKSSGEPLLFKGDDFSRTDLALVTFEDGND